MSKNSKSGDILQRELHAVGLRQENPIEWSYEGGSEHESK
jgi:hypothetical protein